MTLYFWHPSDALGCLSNWSKHAIVVDGITYKTLEHWLMYHKAIFMGDPETADAILKAPTPELAKELGRKVKNFDEGKWVRGRYQIMVQGVTHKMNQHPEVKQKLMSTVGKTIAEASPYDTIWGIGRSATEAARLGFRGQNLLGKAWMQAREVALVEDLD